MWFNAIFGDAMTATRNVYGLYILYKAYNARDLKPKQMVDLAKAVVNGAICAPAMYASWYYSSTMSGFWAQSAYEKYYPIPTEWKEYLDYRVSEKHFMAFAEWYGPTLVVPTVQIGCLLALNLVESLAGYLCTKACSSAKESNEINDATALLLFDKPNPAIKEEEYEGLKMRYRGRIQAD